MFEERLRREFINLQKLAKSEVEGIVEIYYLERADGEALNSRYAQWKSIRNKPTSPLYPYKFKVTYTMPMYVGRNKLKRDWKGTILFEAPENVLMDMNSNIGVQIEDGAFPDDSVPFNNHVTKTFICTGSAWSVAQQGFGIWYFILLIGCLLNQDKFMMDNKPHLNDDALEFWKNKGCRPTNDIKWPFDLDTRGLSARQTKPMATPAMPHFRIGTAKPAPSPSIKFGQNSVKSASPVKKITFGTKK